MELDEFKSKLPEEMAQIKALRDSSRNLNKKKKISSVKSSVESLVVSGAKTGTLTIEGQNVSFSVAAATTSTSPATVLQAKLGTDKEPWLSDEYKQARSKSASAQFGSKGHKKRASILQVADDDRKPAAKKKPAALETAAVSRTVSSVSTGTGMSLLDSPIPKKAAASPKEADAPPKRFKYINLTSTAEADYLTKD